MTDPYDVWLAELEAELAANVARGVAYLDEHIPFWRDRVVVKDLDMASGCDCVLGQIAVSMVGSEAPEDRALIIDDGWAVSYDYILEQLSYTLLGTGYNLEEYPTALGFDYDPDRDLGGYNIQLQYDILKRLWTNELAKTPAE